MNTSDFRSSVLSSGLGLEESLIQILSDVNLLVECQHFSFVVLNLISLDLVHVPLLVIQLLKLGLKSLKSNRLIEQIPLQLVVVSVQSSKLHFVPLLDLVHLH